MPLMDELDNIIIAINVRILFFPNTPSSMSWSATRLQDPGDIWLRKAHKVQAAEWLATDDETTILGVCIPGHGNCPTECPSRWTRNKTLRI